MTGGAGGSTRALRARSCRYLACLSPTDLALVLASALLHALWSVSIKQSGDPLCFNLLQIWIASARHRARGAVDPVARDSGRGLGLRAADRADARALPLLDEPRVRARRPLARLPDRALHAGVPAARRGAAVRRSAASDRGARHRRGGRGDVARAPGSRVRAAIAHRAGDPLCAAHAVRDRRLLADRQGGDGPARGGAVAEPGAARDHLLPAAAGQPRAGVHAALLPRRETSPRCARPRASSSRARPPPR